jgi:hypothetical protein
MRSVFFNTNITSHTHTTFTRVAYTEHTVAHSLGRIASHRAQPRASKAELLRDREEARRRKAEEAERLEREAQAKLDHEAAQRHLLTDLFDRRVIERVRIAAAAAPLWPTRSPTRSLVPQCPPPMNRLRPSLFAPFPTKKKKKCSLSTTTTPQAHMLTLTLFVPRTRTLCAIY